ncbi:MAG: phosphodiester glycosidase family protein [Bacteroidales bacterium]|nr:phosphodiester glycosidase family protein [Bacteroidales bacterium]
MKRVFFFCVCAALAASIASCTPSVIPEPKPQEKEEQPQEPEPEPEPEKPSYPIDVQAAFEDAGLIGKVKSCTHYSPHSSVDVTEIRYTDYASQPQAVFVMQVDLSDPTVSMTNTVPGGATSGFTGGREKLSAQLRRIDAEGSRVIGGINTDFFITDAGATAGQAQGIFWHNGICLKDTFNSQTTRPRCFVYWDGDETVRIANSSYYTQIKSATKLREAFSGGQFLVVNGGYSTITADSVSGVHPRTMFGVQEDGKKVILVVLDGRNSVLAVGMDYPDMQKIMKALGSFDSINIDGGGSSTFIVRDTSSGGYGTNAKFLIKNMPSDGTERAIGPGLAIVASD